jgi:serine/threonine-protein kinase
MGNLIGSEVAGYRVLEELGSHAGVKTYRAVSGDERTSVAIKFFPKEVSRNRHLFLQLRDAMRAVFRLDHPNILPIIGSGTHDSHPYIITTYMSTGSLADRYLSGTLAVLNVGHAVVQIASALEFAHRRGISHGDLKPSNILFGEDGQVQVVDFGQAPILQKLEQDPDQIYLAPEVQGGAGITAASDQYNFGALALEMLTGVPFEQILHELNARSGSSRSMPYHWETSVSPEVIEVLRRAISIDPDQRFASMTELMHALRVALGLATRSVSQDEPANEHPRPPRTRRSNRFLVLLSGALAMALCMIVTFPALSAFWEGLRIDLNLNSSPSTPTSELNVPQNTDDPITNPAQGETIILATDQDPTGDNPTENEEVNTQPTSDPTSHEEPSLPTSAPSATHTIVYTATSLPSDTPTTEPTPTATLVDTLPPSPTSTVETPSPPPPEPTINPHACKDKVGHENYCTPTP